MEYKITWQKILFAVVFFVFVFSEQVFDSVAFFGNLSNEIDSSKIKYLLSILAICVLCLSLLGKFNHCTRFRNESKSLIAVVVVLGLITFIKQLINGFQMYSLEELLFLAIPIIFTYLLVNQPEDEVHSYVDIAFWIVLFVFVLNLAGSFSIKNLLKIDFLNSYSPFESELSFYAAILFFYYLYFKKRWKAILSLIIVVVSLKRFAVVFCLAIFLVTLFGNTKWIYKKPSRQIIVVASITFIIIPLVFHLFCTDGFAIWFYEATGQDLNALMSGRLDRFKLCLDNEMLYGLGSSTDFLSRVLYGDYNRNLHNDILRIYLECGILGSIAFSVGNFNVAKDRNMSFILVLYLFVDMLFNHFLGAGRVAFWILIYLAIYSFNSNEPLHSRSLPERHKFHHDNSVNYIEVDN